MLPVSVANCNLENIKAKWTFMNPTGHAQLYNHSNFPVLWVRTRLTPLHHVSLGTRQQGYGTNAHVHSSSPLKDVPVYFNGQQRIIRLYRMWQVYACCHWNHTKCYSTTLFSSTHSSLVSPLWPWAHTLMPGQGSTSLVPACRTAHLSLLVDVVME